MGTTAGWSRNAWTIVIAGGIVMGLALGVRHVQGLFLLPVTAERGWSRELFGLAMAVQNLTWGLAQPFAGMVADRFGASRVVAAGVLCYALGACGMAFATTPAGFVLSAGVCVGLALSGTTFGVIYASIARLVAPERRGWALGMAGAIAGAGQFALVPAVQGLVGGWGWQTALVVLAAAVAVAMPLAFALSERRASQAEAPVAEQPLADAIREAFSHSGFWLLNLGFFACGFQLAFVATHLPAYLLDHGMSASTGVAALATIALANVFGIYASGLLGERFRRKYLLSGVYLLRTLAMALFVLLPLSPWTVYAFAAAMGLLWLGTVPLTNGVLTQVFGLRYLGTLFGFVFFGHQLGSFLGVWLGGHVFDATGSYRLIWIGAMALGLVSALLHWPIDDRAVARLRPAGAPA